METVRLPVRGVPVWQLERYLTDLGGWPGGAGFTGDGWSVSFFVSAVALGPSVQFEEVVLTFVGDAAAIETVIAGLKLRCLRTGG